MAEPFEIDSISQFLGEKLNISDYNSALLVERSHGVTPGLSDAQLAEQNQWLTLSKRASESLQDLNNTLRDRTYLLNTQTLSLADVVVMCRLFPLLKTFSKDQTVNYRHIVRWFDLVQNQARVAADKMIKIDQNIDAPREFKAKEKKPETGSKTAAKPVQTDPAKSSKPKKEKPEPKAASSVVDPSLIDLRVGFIEKAIKHPDADSLYVSTINLGDPEGPRTICSGLVKHYPLEAMQQRLIVGVANLKPVTMRGVKSCGMVLCASNDDKVEFVVPPQGSKPGDRLFFETFDGEPLPQLNPKKKVWETVQPHFTTDADLQVVYRVDGQPDRKLVNKEGLVLKSSSISAARVS